MESPGVFRTKPILIWFPKDLAACNAIMILHWISKTSTFVAITLGVGSAIHSVYRSMWHILTVPYGTGSFLVGHFLEGLYMCRYLLIVVLLFFCFVVSLLRFTKHPSKNEQLIVKGTLNYTDLFLAIQNHTHQTTFAIHTHAKLVFECSSDVTSAIRWHGAAVS